jgi:hypothetical protein
MITLNIKQEEMKSSLNFATEIIFGGNQFDRFNQSVATQITRNYVVKLAGYIFLHFLQSCYIIAKEGDMFEIFQGAENADTFDFLFPNGQSIDIKTASLPFHQRIMVPISQFHLCKYYYVGIKLNFITTTYNIEPNNINTAIIQRYINSSTLKNQPSQNFVEGDCKAFPLRNLLDIEQLILMYNDAR